MSLLEPTPSGRPRRYVVRLCLSLVRPPPPRKIARVACLLTAALTVVWTAVAGAQSVGGQIDAKSLGDRVLIRVLLQTEAYEKKTHVIVDYAAPEAFAMNGNVLQSLAFGENEQTLKILGDGFRLEVPRDQISPEPGFLGDYTARYSNELEDLDVSAIMGFPVLQPFALSLDFEVGELALKPTADADVAQAAEDAAVVIQGVRIVDNKVHLPVSYDGGKPASMTFGTAGYHTYVNQPIAERVGKPAGDVDDIAFGTPPAFGLPGRVAFFPQPFDERPADLDVEWLLRSGLGLWSAYRLEINPNAGYLALTPHTDSNHSEADAAFYAAAAAEDIPALKAYIEAWPEDRNIEEAAGRWFDIGLRSGMPDEAQMEAVAAGLSVTPERRKTRYISGLVVPLFNSDLRDERSNLVIALCEEALKYIGRSDQPSLRQNIQLVLGDRYLHAGNAHEAWKTLLSAAFYGDPRLDGVVRHELGRAYEALGRHRRAYSSYRRAAADLTPAPRAIKESAREALARLRPLLDPDDELLEEEAPGG